mmetsp:Transcript_9955/g.27044  ORF Transcript_9955/g.27044 Transcript_9955/m.27044 type:complete len:254 (-) Transcript_9955:777-1538(-)
MTSWSPRKLRDTPMWLSARARWLRRACAFWSAVSTPACAFFHASAPERRRHALQGPAAAQALSKKKPVRQPTASFSASPAGSDASAPPAHVSVVCGRTTKPESVLPAATLPRSAAGRTSSRKAANGSTHAVEARGWRSVSTAVLPTTSTALWLLPEPTQRAVRYVRWNTLPSTRSAPTPSAVMAPACDSPKAHATTAEGLAACAAPADAPRKLKWREGSCSSNLPPRHTSTPRRCAEPTHSPSADPATVTPAP